MTRVEQAHKEPELIDIPEIDIALVAHHLFVFRTQKCWQRWWCIRPRRHIFQKNGYRIEWKSIEDGGGMRW